MADIRNGYTELKFKAEYKQPEFNEEFWEETWSEAVQKIGGTCTSLTVIDEREIKHEEPLLTTGDTDIYPMMTRPPSMDPVWEIPKENQ